MSAPLRFLWGPGDIEVLTPEKKYSPEQLRDDQGRWTDSGSATATLEKPSEWSGVGPFIGSDHGKPYVGVKAGTLPDGVEAYNMPPDRHGNSTPTPKQESGAPIRGKGIKWDDKRIPATVYHVTTNLPAVLDSGYLRAGGVGGLGGDNADRIVSMTIDKKIADQLVPDIQLSARISQIPKIKPYFDHVHKLWVAPGARDFTKQVLDVLDADGAKYGFKWDALGARDPMNAEFQSTNTYDTGDWLRQYFSERQHATGVQDPVIMTDKELLAKIDPDKVGIVQIPRQNLNTGAQLTDFDLDREPPYSLKEVRLYGDVPIGPQAGKKGLMDWLVGGNLLADAVYLVSESRRKAAEEEARVRAEDMARDAKAFDPSQARDEEGRWTDSGSGQSAKIPALPHFQPETAKINDVIKGMHAPGSKDDPAALMPVFTQDDILNGTPERWLHERFSNTTFQFNGMSVEPEFVNPVAQQLTRLLTWFPDVPLASVNVRDDPNVGVNEWAHVEYESGGRIVLAQRWWGDAANFQKSLDESVASKWHPNGPNTPESVLTHEFGHHMAHWLKQQGDKSVLPAVYSDDLGKVGSTTEDFIDYGDMNKRGEVSKYAGTNKNEAFAEGFAALLHQPSDQWASYTRHQKALLETVGDQRNWLAPALSEAGVTSKVLEKVRDGQAWAYVHDVRDEPWANPEGTDVTAAWYAAKVKLRDDLGIDFGPPD